MSPGKRIRKLKNAELGRIGPEEYRKAPKSPIVVMLDNVRSLNNTGSVFRTADAFRIESILLCGITGTPPHREIQKTALGSTDSVPWLYFKHTEDAVHKMQDEDYRVVSIEQTVESIPLHRFSADRDSKYALVFGHEIRGVDQKIVDMSDLCIDIPQFGIKHSFNISVSAGIVLWEFHRQLKNFR